MARGLNLPNSTISPQDDAFLYHVMTGLNGVFRYGNMMAYNLESVNNIQILDGFAQIQGRNYIIYPSETVDVTITSGSQGTYRYDLVCLQFTKDSDSETMELVCVEGTETEGTPTDPTLTQDDTLSSGTIYQMPLYRVRLDGINVDGVDDLREYIPSLYDVYMGTNFFLEKGDGYVKRGSYSEWIAAGCPPEPTTE